MKTLPKQISLFTEASAESSRGVFLASPTQKQASGSAKKTSATSGQKCLEQFGRFNQIGLWAKTFAGLLIGREGWFSTRCKLAWKLKGTKSSRLYFQLAVSTLRIEEIGFGLLLKTPSAMDSYSENLSKKEQKFGNSGTLAQEVQTGFIYKRGLLPTPTTQEPSSNCELTETGRRKGAAESSESHSLNLGRMAAMGLIPTPRAQSANAPCQHGTGGMGLQEWAAGMLPTPAYSNHKGASRREALEARGRLKPKADDLANQFAQDGMSSQLNPQFVSEMMGFPLDWLTLPFQNGATNQSKPSGTP
jgi:hypothetical protein